MKVMLTSFIIAACCCEFDLEATTAKLQEMTADQLQKWADQLRHRSKVNGLLYQSYIQ